MLKLSRMGVVISPPVPAFYSAAEIHRRDDQPLRVAHPRSVRYSPRRAALVGLVSIRWSRPTSVKVLMTPFLIGVVISGALLAIAIRLRRNDSSSVEPAAATFEKSRAAYGR